MIDNRLMMLRLLTSAPQCSKRIYRALKVFDSAGAIFSADKQYFIDSGFKEEEISSFFSKDISSAERYFEYCEKNSIKIITYYDDAYPVQLRELEEPPAILFVKGNLPSMKSMPALGVVGTRECSPYGGKFSAALSYELAQVGFVIVSGMARGIDTYAHKGALLAGGTTVAVLPCGVDIATPSGNRELYSRICNTGAVVSEYLPGTQCKPYNFHLRNRIISGLSHGIVVVETAKKGGSMITVRHALEQGKTVFAVPGNPSSKTSSGTNDLIRSGAVICTCSEDIIKEYESFLGCELERPKKVAHLSENTNLNAAPSNAKSSLVVKSSERSAEKNIPEAVNETVPRPIFYCALSEREELIINSLKDGPLSVDELCDITGLIFPNVISILNGFEVGGYVESLPGGLYRLKS